MIPHTPGPPLTVILGLRAEDRGRLQWERLRRVSARHPDSLILGTEAEDDASIIRQADLGRVDFNGRWYKSLTFFGRGT